ncbi:AraC family transcriptional regulator [Cytophagaceae bacterium YF14B1]|uniref:AraC family transcriptional regulator n=1 Tax=Xanthocytophaga flava TaxID=3048013 RepID=A0AAE3U7R8_9BACT|nr:AraC family transcriptional regulator [Xanthocytophaga flavus]MDJ1481907.1 AraC family transcriptional regulator [Xanthocytophaga flavus]
MSTKPSTLPIQYSCYFHRSRAGEQFIPEHTISYIVSGSMEMSDITTRQSFQQGDIYFCRRNQLAKYAKQPPADGEYRSVSIYFDQDTLRRFNLEYGYKPDKTVNTPAFIPLTHVPVLISYMESLRAYEQLFTQKENEALLTVKQNEALLLLLQLKPELKNILFDFSEPGKIDLEAFMNQNYHFNVDLQRFAYLTGRSLSTFKRDFEKVFQDTPSHWLIHRRLKEAYYLIKEKKKTASDVYLDLGFEDLSHFSYVFKKAYGISPSMV